MGIRALARLRFGSLWKHCGLRILILFALKNGIAEAMQMTCFSRLHNASEVLSVEVIPYDRTKHAMPWIEAVHQPFLNKNQTRDAYEEVKLPTPRKKYALLGTPTLHESDFHELGLIDHPMRFDTQDGDRIHGSIVGIDANNDLLAIRLKSGETIVIPNKEISNAARLKNEFIPPEAKLFVKNIISGDFSFNDIKHLDESGRAKLRAVAELAQHYGDEENFADIDFEDFGRLYQGRLERYENDLTSRLYLAKNGMPIGDSLKKYTERLLTYTNASPHAVEEHIETVEAITHSTPDKRLLPNWIQEQAKTTMTKNQFTLPQFKSINDAAAAGNIFAGTFVDSHGDTQNVGDFVKQQIFHKIDNNKRYNFETVLEDALNETWVAAAKPHLKELATSNWPTKIINPQKLPSREDVAKAIKGLNNEDFRRLPTQSEVDEFNRQYDSGKKESECGRNPYAMKCYAFSNAYTHFLTYKGIASFHVSSYPHDFVLIPVRNGDKTETLIFDPSFRQMFNHAKDTFFLGTREELIEYHQKNPNFIQDGGLTFERAYTQQLRVMDNAGWQFEKNDIPTSFASWFDNPDKLTDLDGRRNPQERIHDSQLEILGRFHGDNYRNTVMQMLNDHESEQRARQRYTQP